MNGLEQLEHLDHLDHASNKNQRRTKNNKKSFWSYVAKEKYLYLLALPGLLYFLVFKYFPMLGIVIAFQDYSPFLGIWKSDWVGLQNFTKFFSHPDFWMLFRNTMAISVLNLTFFFPLPILLALMLNELRIEAFKRTIQSIIYLPHFLSWVIIASLSFMLFSQSNGVINYFLDVLGLAKFDFLTNSNTFWFLLTGQSMWKEAGWGTILFLAAIAGINPQLYEAAKMDGANRLRQVWHITLPAIRNIIIILLILRLGDILEVGFEQIFLMYNGAVSEVAEVFDTYVYRVGIQQGQFSYSTAVGLFKSVIGLTLVVSSNTLAKKFGDEGVY